MQSSRCALLVANVSVCVALSFGLHPGWLATPVPQQQFEVRTILPMLVHVQRAGTAEWLGDRHLNLPINGHL